MVNRSIFHIADYAAYVMSAAHQVFFISCIVNSYFFTITALRSANNAAYITANIDFLCCRAINFVNITFISFNITAIISNAI